MRLWADWHSTKWVVDGAGPLPGELRPGGFIRSVVQLHHGGGIGRSIDVVPWAGAEYARPLRGVQRAAAAVREVDADDLRGGVLFEVAHEPRVAWVGHRRHSNPRAAALRPARFGRPATVARRRRRHAPRWQSIARGPRKRAPGCHRPEFTSTPNSVPRSVTMAAGVRTENKGLGIRDWGLEKTERCPLFSPASP